MSTTALQIVQLVKSLPPAEQRAVCDSLAHHGASLRPPTRRRLQRLPDGTYFNPDGIPNDDPVFKILERIEEERHQAPSPPAPEFD